MSTLAHRGTHCGCPKCLASQREKMIDRLTRDSLKIAVRHAQEHSESWAFEARRPGFPDLPTSLPSKPFTLQWTEPVPIRTIPAAGYTGPGGPSPTFMRLFNNPGQNLIYAVLRKGTVYPLYIGMVPGARATMRSRLDRHVRGIGTGSSTSGTGRLNNELRTRGSDLYLALATYTAPGFRTNPNMTRVVEGLVQERMRPRFWSPDVWTFEEEEEAELAELLEGEL
jgi:hypothetical protein